MQKKWTVISGQWSVKKQFKNFFHTVHCSLTTDNSQKGVGQILLVLLMVAGLAVATYVVQNRTNLIPHAAENVEPGYCEAGYTFNGGDAAKDENWEYTGCGQNEDGKDKPAKNSCQYDEKYEEYQCKDGYRCWNDFYKSDQTSCQWQPKDPHYHCKADDTCKNYDLRENSDRSEEDCKKAGGTWKENRCFTPSSTSQGGESAPGNQASSSNGQYDQGDCRDGAQVYKDGYTWIAYCNQVCKQNSDCSQNTSEGAVNAATSNWCYGFNNGQAPRCMKLVQSDNKEVSDQNRKSINTKAVEEIKKTVASGGNPNPAGQNPVQTVMSNIKAQIDSQITQRQQLTGELSTILNVANSNPTLANAINKAQSLLSSAASNASSCYTNGSQPQNDACNAQAQAANDIAVAAGRVALFDAVMAGVPNTCVKVDMAVGANTANSLVEVNPTGSSIPSRLFMCRGQESTPGAKDGDIKWRVRDENGNLQEVSQESLNRLGIRDGQNPNSIPQDFVNRRNNAATLASQPAYSSSNTSANSSTTSNSANESVNNCRTDIFCQSQRGTGSICDQTSRCTTPINQQTSSNQQSTTTQSTQRRNLEKGATCQENSWCKSNQCNPGTNKCI